MSWIFACIAKQSKTSHTFPSFPDLFFFCNAGCCIHPSMHAAIMHRKAAVVIVEKGRLVAKLPISSSLRYPCIRDLYSWCERFFLFFDIYGPGLMCLSTHCLPCRVRMLSRQGIYRQTGIAHAVSMLLVAILSGTHVCRPSPIYSGRQGSRSPWLAPGTWVTKNSCIIIIAT